MTVSYMMKKLYSLLLIFTSIKKFCESCLPEIYIGANNIRSNKQRRDANERFRLELRDIK